MAEFRRRLKRYDTPGQARFLTFSCFQRLPLLTRRWTTEAIERARDKHGFHLWAYVLMPEHVHLLILPMPSQQEVGPILSTLKMSVSVRAVRWAKEHSPEFLERLADVAPDGSVTHRFWQRGGGYDRNLWSPKHVWEAIDYIHGNPVKRELCGRPDEWEWSSFKEWCKPGTGLLNIDREHAPPRSA
jgi:putative transposase